jgi:hypothetical protein
MALKADRRMLSPENIRCVSENAIVKGAAVILGTQGTGDGVGQALNEAAVVVKSYSGSPPSGTKFMGVSLDDVVPIDTTVTPRTSYPPTTRLVGEPLAIAENAELWTNMIVGTPTLEGDAYLAADSKFGVTSVNSNGVVGKWKSTKDTNGYALLQVKTL